jgi:hypothetical protein
MTFLHIATWNINGLAPNKHEVEMFIKTNNLDICLISESHTTSRSRICIPGFSVYLTPHPDGGAHAGSAVIIKNSIKHCLLDPFTAPYLQATTIRVEDRSGPLNLSAVYCPPRHTIKEAMFTRFFESLGNRFIAGGDWNAKHSHWGSRLTTTRGRELKKSCDAINLTPMSTGEPTYWPTDSQKKPDLLDFYITKSICKQNTIVKSSLDGSSDHTPVTLMLSSVPMLQEPYADHLHNPHTDWVYFREYLETNINLKLSLKIKEDVDDACLYFTNILQVAAWVSTPQLRGTSSGTPIPLAIREKIKEKRRLRRIWQQSHRSTDKTKLNRAIKELKDLLADSVNESVRQRLVNITPNGRGAHNLWKATKENLQPQQCSPPIRTGQTWARTAEEKCEAFANHLANIFQPNDTDEPEDPEIDKIIKQDFQLCQPLRPTSPREVTREIRKLDSKKAPGFDLITARLLKELPKKAIVFLTILINATLRTFHVPALWKTSEIIMIHKAGKPPSEPSSYRPISLTPVLSKLWERIFLARLNPCLDMDQIIPDHQFGFRKKHSTIEQVHRVYSTIRQSLESKKYCSAAFLDVQQAFDRVWHKGLLCKIKSYLPHCFFPLMESYLSDRKFRVKLGDARSSLLTCRAGVPQGSVLGPILYNIYTLDLPQTPQVSVATFADDAAFLACSQDPKEASSLLQVQLTATNAWLSKWRIKASAPKSHHITFTLRRETCPPVSLGPATLPQSTCVKYLGFHLDRRMTWKEHIKNKRDEINLRFRNLLWLLGRQSVLSLTNKMRVYCGIIKPIWTYGIQLWSTASKSNTLRVQRAQNNILRVISSAPWYARNSEIHDYLEVPTVSEEARRYSAKYKDRLTAHPNPLSAKLLEPNPIKRLKRANVLPELDES